jgi:hypothetical protein
MKGTGYIGSSFAIGIGGGWWRAQVVLWSAQGMRPDHQDRFTFEDRAREVLGAHQAGRSTTQSKAVVGRLCTRGSSQWRRPLRDR